VPALAPVLAAQTAAQTVTANEALSIALPAKTFTDPQGEALTLTATLASGAALPGWLSFNAATGVLSGTAPTATTPVSVKITATDTSKLSVSETLTINVHAAAPVLASPTPTQDWAPGQAVNFAIPAGSFADPQGEKLSFTATTASGAALPSWLHFNASTGVFTGTPPSSQATLSLKITATDLSNLSVSDIFAVDFVNASAAGGYAAPASGGGWPAATDVLSSVLPHGHSAHG